MHTSRLSSVRNKRPQYGAALLEILIAVGLAALLLTLSIPAAGQLLRRGAVAREAQALREAMERLISASSRYGREVVLSIEKGRYYASVTGGSQKLVTRTLPKTISAEFKTGDDARSIRFYPSGVTSPATIYLSAKEESCRISVSLRGRISVRCT